jgi:hypothetical protein
MTALGEGSVTAPSYATPRNGRGTGAQPRPGNAAKTNNPITQTNPSRKAWLRSIGLSAM